MIKNLFSLEGKSVAVIGAGSGIGQAVAIGTAQQGAYVCCLDVNAEQSGGDRRDDYHGRRRGRRRRRRHHRRGIGH